MSQDESPPALEAPPPGGSPARLIDPLAEAVSAAGSVANFLHLMSAELEREYRRPADRALDYQRQRKRHWKAADTPRLRHLDQAANPSHKLTPAEHRLLAELEERPPRGRPGGHLGPESSDERISRWIRWHNMPRRTRAERRAFLKASPLYRRGLLEAYEGEYARLIALGERPAHEKAEQAVAAVYLIAPATVHRICSEERRRRLEQTRAIPGAYLSGESDVTALEQRRCWIEQGPAPGELF